jgi:hypothetical protein
MVFFYAALFSLALSSFVREKAKRFLPQLPGLTFATLHKYLPHLVATPKGHLDQICKNLRSTNPTKPSNISDPAETHDHHAKCLHSSEVDSSITHYYNTAFISLQPTCQVHLDQTNTFPVASSTDNSYLLLLHDYDSNDILAKPMPKHIGLCILHAYRTINT